MHEKHKVVKKYPKKKEKKLQKRRELTNKRLESQYVSPQARVRLFLLVMLGI